MTCITATNPQASDPTPADTLNQPHVLCFGEALMNRINGSGVNGGGTSDHPGGAPASVACGVARLGTCATFLGRIGADPIGQQLVDLFEQRQVAMPALQVDPKRPTRVARLALDEDELTFEGFQGDLGLGFADTAVVPATLAESVQPLLREARWLLIGTNALAGAPSAMALDLLRKRATAQGVGIALEIDWRPGFWGLPAEAPPSSEVRRRFRPLAETASLILCTSAEAEGFFGSRDPAAIHAALPKRPAVLFLDPDGSVNWCLGGRKGTLPPADPRSPRHPLGVGQAFTAAVLDGLCRQPELLEAPAPGGDGVAGPGPIEEMLRFASACGALVGRGEGAIEPQPSREEVSAFLDG